MKDWAAKLVQTRAALGQTPKLTIVFDLSDSAAPAEFIQKLQHEWPFVDEEYLRFLELSDGAQIGWCVLYGSGNSTFTPLLETLRGCSKSLISYK